MLKDRLKQIKTENYISGIYNYCDRWCERCLQTSRCLNYALSEEEFADPETRDIRNEAFWKKLSDVLRETLEFVRETAGERGIDLENLDAEESIEDDRLKDDLAENHIICRAARAYGDMVDDRLDSVTGPFIEGLPSDKDETDLKEAVEVIRWYQHFIYVKLMRATRGELDEKDEPANEFPKDSEGSAKVALIAIDRSIGAWGVIQYQSFSYEEKILDLIAYLDRLREAVEKTFPGARSFIRSGLDKIDPNR